jgi:hypothetical protein
VTRQVVYTAPIVDRPPVQADFGPPPKKAPRRAPAVPYMIRRERYLLDPEHHGTATAYHNWQCRCGKCRDAWRLQARSTRVDRFTREFPDGTVHGSESTYNNYGCRCDACKATHNAGVLSRKKRKKAA